MSSAGASDPDAIVAALDRLEAAFDEVAVVVSASARLMAHPRQKDMSEGVGPQTASWRAGFTGWTVAERLTMDRYRVKAL
jgi:hypothetical protein